MKETFFFLIGVPIFISILYYGLTGSLIYNMLNKNKEFRKKWTGWGGTEFWNDAKKIEDTKLQKLIYTFEVICPKLVVVGFVISAILAIIFNYIIA